MSQINEPDQRKYDKAQLDANALVETNHELDEDSAFFASIYTEKAHSQGSRDT